MPDRLVHDRAYAMDSSLLHSLGWKLRTAPAGAISRAATDLYAAWRDGAGLTAPRSGRR